MKRPRLTLALWLALLVGVSSAQAATIVVDFFDGGDGFHSGLPADPLSTAPGATLGEQRRASFEAAAAQWGARLTSNVTIVVEADMVPLTCNGASALLGAAGPTTIVTDWMPGPGGSPPAFAATWYPLALANRLANVDLVSENADVGATFNSDLDDNDACLTGTNWYYSLDSDPGPPGTLSFHQTVLHEIAHGVGFSSFVDPSTGAPFLALLDVFSRFLADDSAGLTWDQMTNAQRAASAIDTGDLVWSGPAVTAGAAALTSGTVNGRVRMYAPNPVEPGSSVSHFAPALGAAGADELMEPFATDNGAFLVTDQLFADIGWGSSCGNGAIDAGEGCDDGNVGAGDGCGTLCAIEQCFTCDGAEPSVCTPLTGAACDDGLSCSTEICNAGVCETDPSACTLDHFKLYRTKQVAGLAKFDSLEIALADQFESKQTRVVKPLHLGNPVDKSGEGVSIVEAHLVCYRIKDAKTEPAQAKFARRTVQTTNPFGTQTLDVLKAATVCVPSAQDESSTPPPLAASVLDHFKCYKAKPAPGSAKFVSRTVTLVDRFESKETLVVKPAEICNPVDNDGEGILGPARHLQCYRIKDAKISPLQAKFSGVDVFTTNQFGSESLRGYKADRLCVPSSKQDL